MGFISDPGFLNTLGNILTTEEGFILRPLSKWFYLKPILPSLLGKSVLEIGCNNGFFCFEFEKLGAAFVTEVEVFDHFSDPALWMAKSYQSKVNILKTDALLDLTLPAHDVIFMSEVYGHFVDPFFGLLRAVNLAKETLILDNAISPSLDYQIDLGADIDPTSGNLIYHAWLLSDGLILSYLFLCGIPPERVKRYVAPWDNHLVYVIDTSDVARFREDKMSFQPCNISFLNMRMTST